MPTFRGFATISFYADDLAAAAAWYTELFEVKPYYEVPGGYLEFRIGDDEDEFGIINRRYAPPGAANPPGGAIMYWHVDDLAATVAKLLAMGATEYQPITEQGEGAGFTTASVVDPFGNVLGVMTNPHYREIRSRR
jgi:predicted enzyme related to lactoylglutathione lyase